MIFHSDFNLRGSIMRVISRHVNEGLVIGDDIFVTVLEIQDDFVRLGISDSAHPSEYEEHVIYLEESELEEELQTH